MGEILVAYDGGDAARRALESGLAHAQAGQGDLVVLVVAGLDAAKAQCAEAGVEARFVEAVGDPGETIVRYADEHPVEVIVLGSGANATPPPSLGTVTTAVSKDVRCDVVLVP